MPLAERAPRKPLIGRAKPRVAPPVPARSDIKAFHEMASSMGIELMPWQDTAARYLTATGADGKLLYREVCIVVARQNGKTTLTKPLIIRGLRAGKKILHIAQNRNLPRRMFDIIADALSEEPELFPKRRGRTIWPRYGAGQEEIILASGGEYRIAAAGRGGARGLSTDIVIIDELREMDTFEVIEAAQPTLTMSPDPQMVYLSNAGHDGSVVLNAVRQRAERDTSLAYLEWSAAPERPASDVTGWAEANPALGHYPAVMDTLERAYRSHSLGGTLAIFETENLCRWVPTMRERLLDGFAWARCETTELPDPVRPFMAVSMDPSGTRASAAIAWQVDDAIAVRLLFDVTGEPIDTPKLGDDMAKLALRLGVTEVAYDPLTDADLARYFRKSRKVVGQEFANASARFVTAALSTKIRWLDETGAITDDLAWTARKPHDESGSFQAVRSKDERPITASLAAIRAVWLASGPRPAVPQVM
jgi:hypothetical protein